MITPSPQQSGASTTNQNLDISTTTPENHSNVALPETTNTPSNPKTPPSSNFQRNTNDTLFASMEAEESYTVRVLSFLDEADKDSFSSIFSPLRQLPSPNTTSGLRSLFSFPF